jgi:hypothetical protein
MKDRPEIEGEIRGLLQEIVDDPRSSARLAPRRPMREWFDGGEAIRAREVDGTAVERHLVAAHREALAAMLLEAAQIAYWQAPILSFRPIGPDAAPYDERAAEVRWRPLVRRRIERTSELGAGVDLLRACLDGIRADQGHALAQASLSLVPSDAARYYVTRTLPWDRPRTAIALLERLVGIAQDPWRIAALSSLGARRCSTEEFGLGLKAYREATTRDPQGCVDMICVFNLSCLLEEPASVLATARTLDPLLVGQERSVRMMAELLRTFWRDQNASRRSRAHDMASRLRGSVPERAAILCEVYQT